MINVFDKNKNISYYDTIDEFINHIESSKSMRYNSSNKDDYGFTGTHSFKEACELCKYGDKQLANEIYNTSLTVNDIDTINKIKQNLVNDVVGFTPNVANYVMGIPNNMIKDDRTKIKSKVLNIFINVACAWHISKEDMRKNATQIVCAITSLEQQGYRCNIYSGAAGEHRNDTNLLIVKIKSDKEPLNLDKMAFPMCHPSMLRRLKFKWLEITPIDFGSNYGSTITNETKINKLINNIIPNTKFTIMNISKSAGEISNIVEQLKTKGIIINE